MINKKAKIDNSILLNSNANQPHKTTATCICPLGKAYPSPKCGIKGTCHRDFKYGLSISVNKRIKMHRVKMGRYREKYPINKNGTKKGACNVNKIALPNMSMMPIFI